MTTSTTTSTLRSATRRAVLRGLAVLAPFVAVAPAALSAPTAAIPADATRIAELCERWRDLQRQADELDARIDAIEADAEATPPPAALLRREDDGFVLGTVQAVQLHPRIGERYHKVHVHQLRQLSGEWLDKRSAEIVAAFDTWRSNVAAAMAPARDVEDQREAVLDQRDEVHAQIVAAPVVSLAGVTAKAALAQEITARPSFDPENDTDGVLLALQVARDAAGLTAVTV